MWETTRKFWYFYFFTFIYKKFFKNCFYLLQELQEKLDKDNVTLAQLESEKGEAQTRLEELDQHKCKLDDMLADIKLKLQQETEHVCPIQLLVSIC